MLEELDPNLRRLIAAALGAAIVGGLRHAIGPELSLHPVVGAFVVLALNEIVQPAMTNDLIRRGL
jgi:hypothetical protein